MDETGMCILAERLVGKYLRSIDTANPQSGLGILFADNARITVHSSVAVSIASLAKSMRVEKVTIGEKDIELHLAADGFIKISTDWDKHAVVEAFVFLDVDGTCIVENGT